MHPRFPYIVFLTALVLLIPRQVSADQASDIVWQLGTLDGKSTEFVSISENHFLFDAAIGNRSEYDRQTHTFTCKLKENGDHPTPSFPAGLVTMETNFVVGNWVPRRAVIEWNDDTGGPVELEIHTEKWRMPDYFLPAGRFSFDNYGDFLRVDTPDNGTSLFPLPITSASAATPMGRGEGDLNWRVQFTAAKGTNKLELSTYACAGFKNVYFDQVVLKRQTQAPVRKPVVVLSTPELANAFFDGDRVRASASLYNLDSKNNYTANFRIEDFFGRQVDAGRLDVSTAEDGTAVIPLQPKITKRGHFKLTFWLTDPAGNLVELGQCLNKPILPIAMIAPPEEPGSRDIESSFGFVGGMCAYSNNTSIDDVDRLMKVGYMMGARWHRFDMFSWLLTEPDKGTYLWGPLDAAVDVTRRNGIRIMGELAGTPDWAKENPNDSGSAGGLGKFEVPKLDEWTRYVRDVAARYADSVDAWEYMNEPGVYYGVWQGKKYGEMMKAVTPIIHSINPHAKVVMGCAGIDEKNSSFALDAVTTSGPEAFDVFTYHYLGYTGWDYAKDLMAKAGVADKPVWDTEQHFAGASLDEEARQVVRQYAREFASGVQKVFYFDIMKNMVWGASDMWMSPLMVAHRTLAHRLDHTRFLCAINPAPDVEGYAFLRENGAAVLVLWNNAAADFVQRNDAGTAIGGQSAVRNAWQEVRLTAGKSKPWLVDIMDNETRLRSENGKVQLSLAADPVFIEGIDPDTLLAQAAIRCSPAQAVIKSGGNTSHRITVKNVFGKPIRGGLKLTAEAGLKLKTSGLTFALKPGESKDFVVDVQTPANARHKTWRVGVSAPIESGQRLTDEFEVLTHPTGPGVNLVTSFQPDAAGKVWSSDTITIAPGEFCSLAVTATGTGRVALEAQFRDRLGRILASREITTFASTAAGARGVGAVCTPQGAVGMSLRARPAGECALSDAEIKLLTTGNINLTKVACSAMCPKLDQPMQVDGDFLKWENLGLQPIVIDRLDQVRRAAVSGGLWDTNPYDWRGPNDLSGQVYVAWDSDNLYIAAKVLDDISRPSINRWKDDTLGLGHAADDFHFAIDPDNGTQDVDFDLFTQAPGRLVLSPVREYITRQIRPKDREVAATEAHFITKAIDGGHVFEAAIPWKLLGLDQPSAGVTLGFRAGMNEADSGYRGWIEWAPRSLSPFAMDPAELGQITLTD